MEGSKDIRGVARGRCIVCTCVAYASTNGLLCTSCRHPPMKHEKSDYSQSHRGVGAYGNTCTGNSSGISSPRQLPSVGTNSYDYYHTTLNSTPHISSSTHSTYKHQTSWPSCPCSKPVFYDENFGFFEYCSPKCRDEYFLPEYNKKLDEDIERFHAECKASHSHTVSKLPTSSKSNVRKVTIETKPKEDLGLILCHNKESQKVIVTGAKTENAIKMLINTEVYLFDVITKVFDQEVKNPNDIDEIVKPKTTIDLLLDRENALTFSLTAFCQKGKRNEANRIICIQNDVSGYGFTVNGKVIVDHVSRDSQAQRCGLKHGDKIKVYAPVSQHSLHEMVLPSTDDIFYKDIDKAVHSGQHLLLAVYSKS